MATLLDLVSDTSRVVVVKENVLFFDVGIETGLKMKKFVALRVVFAGGLEIKLFASTPETVDSLLTGIMLNDEIKSWITKLSE